MSYPPPPLRSLAVFAGYGVEIEYMIVDRERLNVRPLADKVLRRGDGRPVTEVVRGAMGWSNELALHVLELKNLRPVPMLDTLLDNFHAEVTAVNALLATQGAQLMPGGMHPWMDPRTETHLWPHDHGALYRSYDQLFDCRRHGWSNVQSLHVNLPFANDAEFARLHAAIRLALPILPALAASSPWADGRATGFMDYRLALYRQHQHRLPASMGNCIPDTSTSPAHYQAQVLDPMYRELDALCLPGEAGLLRHEWLNARAAIPRFERNAIEIRVLDTQECPLADFAVVAATTALIRRLYDEHATGESADTAALSAIFDACVRDADQARIVDAQYLDQLGFLGAPCRAGELWSALIDALVRDRLLAPVWVEPLSLIRERGPLARRLDAALGGDARRLPDVYQELCQCLRDNRMYPGPARPHLPA